MEVLQIFISINFNYKIFHDGIWSYVIRLLHDLFDDRRISLQ